MGSLPTGARKKERHRLPVSRAGREMEARGDFLLFGGERREEVASRYRDARVSHAM